MARELISGGHEVPALTYPAAVLGGGGEGRGVGGEGGGELLALERSLLSNQQRLKQLLMAKEQNLRGGEEEREKGGPALQGRDEIQLGREPDVVPKQTGLHRYFGT